jgi:hypothetical protein
LNATDDLLSGTPPSSPRTAIITPWIPVRYSRHRRSPAGGQHPIGGGRRRPLQMTRMVIRDSRRSSLPASG